MKFDSYYHFINNSWLNTFTLPNEYSYYGTFDILNNKIEKQLIKILSNNDNILLKKFYKKGLDLNTRNKLKLKPLQKIFELIDSINDNTSLSSTLSILNLLGFSVFYNISISDDLKDSKRNIIYISQDSLHLPSKKYYFDEQYLDIRNEYKKFINKILIEIDPNLDKINDILEFEKKIADITLSNEDKRDIIKTYNVTSFEKLNKLYPFLSFTHYFETIKIIRPDIHDFTNEIIIDDFKYFEKLNNILENTSLIFIKLYIKFCVLISSLNFLDEKMEDLNFSFFGMILSGSKKKKSRNKIIISQITPLLGEILGDIYVKKYFSQDTLNEVNILIKNIVKAAEIKINTNDWMSKETKKLAINKLKKIKYKIGFPKKILDYSILNFSNKNYYDIIILTNLFYSKYYLDKLGKVPDNIKWGMASYEVNAYYNPVKNEMVFPAGILQSPFFDINATNEHNYGGIGTVIAHEISHGFDDQGRLFDENGNLINWWNSNDEKNYNIETNKLKNQFDNLKLDGYNISGQLTLGENIADYSAVSICLLALKLSLKNKSCKLNDFFTSYANIWKYKIRKPEQIKRIASDVHAPGIFRTNQILSNIPEFYDVYNIENNHKMYIHPDLRIKLWK
jgi:putative endopeptidase